MSILGKLFKNKSSSIKENIESMLQATKSENNFSFNPINVEIPPLQGNYAKAIFLYAYKGSSQVKMDSLYQQYLIYECGIKKPSKYHQELIDQGYLVKSSFSDVVKALKVTELKEILSELQKKTSGKKDELIQRVLESADDSIISRLTKEPTYSISEKGSEFLERNIDYIKIHQHKNWDIDWKDYDNRKKPGYKFNDVVWGIFNERVMTSYSFGRNEYYNMYELLEEEGKRKDALEKLLMVFYNDLSGVDGIDGYRLFKTGSYKKKELLDYFDVAVMIAPGIINAVKKHQDVYTPEIVDRIYNAYKLPVKLCDKKFFLEIVESIMNDTFDEEKVKHKLKSEYKKYVDSISH